jgi:two-component system chemotaxis response regulator CheB
MAGRDIILIGASAGGVEALKALVRGLSADLPAAVFVVLHVTAEGPSHLPEILTRSGPLPAAHARDGERVHHGCIYIAPPDYHMLLNNGAVCLSHGARENHARPAIDPLFRSAAAAFGPRVVGVILSGALYDGTAGLVALRRSGGVAVVQDPADALVDSMPSSALAVAGADYVVPAAGMGAVLTNLVSQPKADGGGSTMIDPLDQMPDRIGEDKAAQERGERVGQSSLYSCPECGGVLWQVDPAGPLRFRCHVGHVYYGDGLLAEQANGLEAALWVAVRTFRERAILARQLAVREHGRNDLRAAARFEEQAATAEKHADLIQNLLLQADVASPPPPELPAAPEPPAGSGAPPGGGGGGSA